MKLHTLYGIVAWLIVNGSFYWSPTLESKFAPFGVTFPIAFMAFFLVGFLLKRKSNNPDGWKALIPITILSVVMIFTAGNYLLGPMLFLISVGSYALGTRAAEFSKKTTQA